MYAGLRQARLHVTAPLDATRAARWALYIYTAAGEAEADIDFGTAYSSITQRTLRSNSLQQRTRVWRGSMQ